MYLDLGFNELIELKIQLS